MKYENARTIKLIFTLISCFLCDAQSSDVSVMSVKAFFVWNKAARFLSLLISLPCLHVGALTSFLKVIEFI